MYQERLNAIKRHFKGWLSENTDASQDDIEEYFAQALYGNLVDLQRDLNASNEELGEFVRQLNDYVEYEVLAR